MPPKRNIRSNSTVTGDKQNASDPMAYWNSLFQDTDYWDLYQSIRNSYDVDVPNTLWGAITGKNRTNEYQHEMAMRDELNALAQKMYNESYQDPSAEVARMRNAGLNPDITGLTGQGAAESSPNGIPEGVQAENPMQVIQGAGSIFINALTLGKGIAEGLQTFRGQRLDNLQKLMNVGNTAAGMITPMSRFTEEYLGDITPAEAQLGEIDMLLQSFRLRKKENKQLRSYLRSVVNHPSFKEGYYGNLSRGADNRMDYFRTTAGSHYDEDDGTMRILSKGLSDIINLSEKVSKQRSVSEDSESIEFNDIFDSTLAAEASNATNTEVQSSQKFTNELNSVFRKTVSALEKEADSGSKFAQGVLLAIQFFYLNSPKTSVSFSKKLK